MTKHLAVKVIFWSSAAIVFGACATTSDSARDHVAFSHHVHSEMGASCTDCHGAVLEDRDQKVQAIPSKEGCTDCHDVEDETTCADCHQNYELSEGWPPRPDKHLLFSHQMHNDFEEDCNTCHAGAAHWPDRKVDGGREMNHGTCKSCHQKDLDGARCALCHDRLDLNSKAPLEIYSHGTDGYERHGAQALESAQVCAQCHDQSFCIECHGKSPKFKPSMRYPERVDRNFVHRGDYVSRHAAEARLGSTACYKCHGDNYCAACHERSGVGPMLGARSPHRDDPNWVRKNVSSTGGPSNHGRQARRRIGDCAACHDQGPMSNCVQCHRSGGHNPHPPGWRQKIDARSGASALDYTSSSNMCSICHANRALQ